jgi:hypothetical protein
MQFNIWRKLLLGHAIMDYWNQKKAVAILAYDFWKLNFAHNLLLAPLLTVSWLKIRNQTVIIINELSMCIKGIFKFR